MSIKRPKNPNSKSYLDYVAQHQDQLANSDFSSLEQVASRWSHQNHYFDDYHYTHFIKKGKEVKL